MTDVIYIKSRTFWQWLWWNLRGRQTLFKFPGKAVSLEEMVDHINSMPGGRLWPGGPGDRYVDEDMCDDG